MLASTTTTNLPKVQLPEHFGQATQMAHWMLGARKCWATCDQLLPRCFGRHTAALLPAVEHWIAHSHEYTVRFGMGMLLKHYLDVHFEPRLLEQVARVQREEYYIRMMQAWFFAEALAKQPAAALPYIEQQRMAPWTHNKAIQKATESRRIGAEMKARLRKMRG